MDDLALGVREDLRDLRTELRELRLEMREEFRHIRTEMHEDRTMLWEELARQRRWTVNLWATTVLGFLAALLELNLR